MKRIFISLLAVFSVLLCQAAPRYIIYMIGDGMGVNQVLAAEMYQAELKGEIGRVPLCMTTFPVAGMATTYSRSNSITDSSAAGTCLASGEKTENGHLGTTPEGKPIVSIAEKLHAEGWAVGVTTSVAVDHATPGAFYAHVNSREEYYAIGRMLAISGFEFFGGAGFHKPENKSAWNADNLYDLAEKHGYTIAHGYEQAMDKMGSCKQMLMVQPQDGIDRTKKSESIPFAIDRQKEDLTLPQITEAALRFLERNDRFFLMVEGGKIDYAGHSRDGATNIREVLDFDQAVRLAYEFYLKHPDETLIVITADHETGGMALGNSNYKLNLQLLQNQTMSQGRLSDRIKALYDQDGKKLRWETVRDLLTEALGFYAKVEITPEEDARLQAAYKKMIKGKSTAIKTLYSNVNELAGTAVGMLNKKAKLGWTTYSHTAGIVPVYAIGKGAENFGGWLDNSEIAPRIMEVAH